MRLNPKIPAAVLCALYLTACAGTRPPPPVPIIETKIEAPPIDARLFEHEPAPLPPCVSTDDCVGRYITALKQWGEGLAGKIEGIKAALDKF